MEKLFNKHNIQFRRINTPGQSTMYQIHRNNINFDLKKEINKEGYKLTFIDSTVLIYKNQKI